MRTLTLLAIILSTLSAHQADYKVCTEASKALVDDIFTLIEDLEENPLNPSPQDFKNLLHSLEGLLLDCASIEVNLKKYDNCVEDLVKTLPLIKKLIIDIRDNNSSGVIIDVTTLALQLMNGMQKCANPSRKFVATVF